MMNTKFFLLLIMIPSSLHAQLDIQGHRGCRGLMPENTIEACIKAVELGVTTLELDVVISKDREVIVSHEPYMSAQICLQPGGDPIPENKEKEFNIYMMTTDEIQKYDCGSKGHPKFKQQLKIKTFKPRLIDVIDSIEKYTVENSLKPVYYNIELKSTKAGDNIFHPGVEEFYSLVLNVIEDKSISGRIIIQSFDLRMLQHIRIKSPEIKLALLVENIKGVKYNLKALDFNPHIYSPYYKLLSAGAVTKLHETGIKVIPWTVNREEDMKKMMALGVDGIITDYPDVLLKENGKWKIENRK